MIIQTLEIQKGDDVIFLFTNIQLLNWKQLCKPVEVGVNKISIKSK